MSSLRRQGAWAVVDQMLSSGTNFVPGVLLARALGPGGFGAFSLAFLAWFGALSILRSGLMQPYTLAASSLEGAEWRHITRHASGVVVVGGVMLGGIFAIASLIVGTSSTLGQALLAVAVLAPGMALQEFWRVASFAARRARTAAANDALWAIGQAAAFAFVLLRGHVTVAEGLFAWGAGAWLAAGLGVVQLSVVPKVGLASVRWARGWARTGAWFSATTAMYTFGSLAIAITISANIGSAGLGLFRTVQLLFGPVQLLTIGAEGVFLPHLVRAIDRSPTAGVAESQRYSVLMAGLIAFYGLALLVAEHAVLTRVFGASFAGATVLVLPMLVASTLDALWSGAALLLRARARGARLLVAQVAYTGARVVSVAVLVNVAGLGGAGWALVIGSAVAAFVFWGQVAFATRESTRPDAAASPFTNVLQLAEADRAE